MSTPSSLRIAVHIAATDLRRRVRNRSMLILAVIAPLGLAVIFSQLIGGGTTFGATYVVADLDGGELARVLRHEVLGPLATAGGPFTITDAATEAAARAAVEDGSADAAFIVPAGFTAAITGGQAVTLEVVGARDSGLQTEVARALAQRFGDQVRAVQLSAATAAALVADGNGSDPPDPGVVARIAQAATEAPPPIVLADIVADSRQLGGSSFFAASMAILFLFLSTQVGLVSVLEERRRGTLARILAGPVRPEAILAGKSLGSFAQAALAMTVLVGATTLLIGADWGNPLGVALMCTAAILAAIGISLLTISFTNSPEAAGAASSAVAITLAMVGGTFTPSAPEAMAAVALLTPHGWFLRGLGELHGAGPEAVLPSVGAMLLIALVTGGLGFARARRLVRAR